MLQVSYAAVQRKEACSLCAAQYVRTQHCGANAFWRFLPYLISRASSAAFFYFSSKFTRRKHDNVLHDSFDHRLHRVEAGSLPDISLIHIQAAIDFDL